MDERGRNNIQPEPFRLNSSADTASIKMSISFTHPQISPAEEQTPECFVSKVLFDGLTFY
jgi:hypothetical protein